MAKLRVEVVRSLLVQVDLEDWGRVVRLCKCWGRSVEDVYRMAIAIGLRDLERGSPCIAGVEGCGCPRAALGVTDQGVTDLV